MLTNLSCWLVNRLKREDGATAVEYGVMVALICAVIIVTVYAIGQELLAAFNTVLTQLGLV